MINEERRRTREERLTQLTIPCFHHPVTSGRLSSSLSSSPGYTPVTGTAAGVPNVVTKCGDKVSTVCIK